MSALSSCLVDAASASAPDRAAYRKHCGDTNRLRTYCKRYKSAASVKQAAMKALRYECGERRGPITIRELGEATARLIGRPRGERMARRDAADLVAAGLAVRGDGTIEFCGSSAAKYAKIRIIYRAETQTDKNVRPILPQTRRYVPMSAQSVEKTLLQSALPPRRVRCRRQAASLAGVDLDALDLELASPVLSPPQASTAYEKKKKSSESRLSPAQPVTKATEDCPLGAYSSLLPAHPVKGAIRQLRRAARRTASCEKRGRGRVESAAMPASFAAAVEQMHRKDAQWTSCLTSTSKSGLSVDGSSSWILPSEETTKRTSICGGLICDAENAQAPLSIAHVQTFAGTAARTTKAGAAQKLEADADVPDEELLSPASLATMAALPPMFRSRHRRTLRLMALKRLAEGKPAWETEEEANAPDQVPERPAEAVSRGFSSRKQEEAAKQDDSPRKPLRMPIVKHDDDDVPADAMWIRMAIARDHCLARLPFLPAARRGYTRGIWRAALAKALYRPRRKVPNVAGFVAQAAEELAAGNGRDARLSKWFTVEPGWPRSLAEACDSLPRMAGWEPKNWGPQQYR